MKKVLTLLTSILRSEPTLVFAVVRAGVGLAVAHGLRWNASETTAFMVLVEAVVGLINRQMVTPVSGSTEN